MDRYKNYIFGALVTIILGSGAWGWQYAFSTEARLVKTETMILANMEEQRQFRQQVLHSLDRLEDKIDRIQEIKIPVVIPPKRGKLVIKKEK